MDEVSNYHPITLVPALSKELEENHTVPDDKHNIHSSSLFAFRESKSTRDQQPQS
jgi:hypothetical protein